MKNGLGFRTLYSKSCKIFPKNILDAEINFNIGNAKLMLPLTVLANDYGRQPASCLGRK